MENNLKLSEKLYMLSIRREKGGIPASVSNNLNYVLVGAFILEMLQESAIKVQNKRIQIVSHPNGDEIHKLILNKASGFKKNMRISYWIRRFFFTRVTLKKMLHDSMVSKKLISLEKKKFLFFRWDKPHIYNQKAIRGLHQEITNGIFRGTEEEEQVTFLLLLSSLNIVNRLYGEKEKRGVARKKLKALAADPVVPESVKEVVKAVEMSIRAAHAAAAGAT